MLRLLFIFLFLLLTPTLQAISDTNQNGVSDPWEKKFNQGTLYSTFTPTADSDGDGWTDSQEALAGTDPRSGNPLTGHVRPQLTHTQAVYLTSGQVGTPPTLLTPEAITLTWPTLPGKKYTLFFSPNLTAPSWTQIGEPRIGAGTDIGTGIPLTQPDGSTPAAGFWRVTIADIDTDNDTLTDAEEHQLNSNPNSADTDGDGLTDKQEVEFGTSPNSSDSDRDGLSDSQEIASGHDPRSNQSYPPRLNMALRKASTSSGPALGSIESNWPPYYYPSIPYYDMPVSSVFTWIATMPFPDQAPDDLLGFDINGRNTSYHLYRAYDGSLTQCRYWLQTKPASNVEIKRTFLKITTGFRQPTVAPVIEELFPPIVEKLEVTIPANSTASLPIDILPPLDIVIGTNIVIGNGVNLLPVDLISDLNNDGQITATDNPLRDAALASGATDEIKDKGTEFIFRNDTLSNGIWDKDDTDLSKPADADDDDAEPIRINISSLPDQTQVWLEHPASVGLKYYRDRKCTQEIQLSSSQRHVVGGSVAWPTDNKLFIRAEDDGALTYPPDNPQFEGNLVLKIKVGTTGQEIEAVKMKLTVVKQLGAKKYFHAARDYIMENNSRIFVRDKAYGSSTSFRVVSMLEELARMYPIDAARRTTGAPFKGIDQVNAAYDGSIHVVVNGNMNFFSDDRFNGTVGNIAAALQGLITDKCHGRLVRMNSYDAAVSSDNTSSTSSPEGSDLAGDTYGRYIAQYNQENKYSLAAGRVPLPSPSGGPSAAMGGLSTNYSNADRVNREYQLIGYSKCTDTNKGIVFTATQLTGTGSGPSLAEDAKKSGVAALPNGDADDLQILLLDGGTSTAMAHAKPDGSLSTRVKKGKHTGTLYYINTYLLFHCEKPRP